MWNQKRRNLLLVVVLTLLVSVPVWFFLSRVHHRDKLVVSRISLPSLGLIYLAEERGFFSERNLDVEFISFPTGRDALKSIDSGRADLGTLYQTPVLERALENRPLRILTSLHTSSRGTGILARRDRGILQPSDLANRRIGVPLKTSGELFLKAFLRIEGISWDDIRVVDVPAGEFQSRFLKGDIDALVVWQPAIHSIQSSFPAEKISTFYSDIYDEVSFLVAKDEVIKEKPRAIKRFIEALIAAEAFLHEYPDESFDCITRAFPEEKVEPLRAAWSVYHMELKLDNLTALTLQKELELRRQQRERRDERLDISDLIFPDFLEAVQPEAVTIFRPLNKASRLER